MVHVLWRNPMATNQTSIAAPQFKALMCSSFGASPFLKGEDSQAYETLLAQVCDDIAPSDAIERMWVRDVVDLSWEIFRWRRVKTELIASAVPTALRKILAPLVQAEEYSEWMDALVKLWK